MTIKSILGLTAAGLIALAPVAHAQDVQPRDPQISTQDVPPGLVPGLIGAAAVIALLTAGGGGGGGGSSNNTLPSGAISN